MKNIFKMIREDFLAQPDDIDYASFWYGWRCTVFGGVVGVIAGVSIVFIVKALIVLI